MMHHTKKMLDYWRNCLADSNRMDIDPKKFEKAQTIENGTISYKKLPQENTDSLFEEKEKQIKRLNTKSNESVTLSQVAILISPIRLAPVKEHTKKKYGYKLNPVYPMWIPAQLDRQGNLQPPPDLIPWFVRTVLEPVQGGWWSAVPLGTVDSQDEFLALHEVPTDNWREYELYCRKFFKHVTGQEFESLKVEGYLTDNTPRVVLDLENGDSSDGIIELYDYLRKEDGDKISPLLHNFAAVEPEPTKETLTNDDVYIHMADSHLGQMGKQYPLSESQRQALHHAATVADGGILAVNGPPGTGKTTLLQSIVADSVVKSAYSGKEPEVIVVSSTNNQAIENVIESFGNTESKENLTVHQACLSGRWLPDIHSYALFLPASSKNVEDKIHYTRYHGGGLPDHIENGDYLRKAQSMFREKCGLYARRTFSTVADAVDYLHRQLRQRVDEIKLYPVLWAHLEKARKEIGVFEQFAGTGLEQYRRRLEESLDTHESQLNSLQQLRDEWLKEIRSESFFTRLQLKLGVKSVEMKREARYRMILTASPISTEHLDTGSPERIESFIADAMEEQIRQINSTKEKLEKMAHLVKALEDSETQWQDWKERNGITEYPPKTSNNIDVTLRYEAFRLAVHYWEGRWLLDVEMYLQGDSKGKTRKEVEARWRRYAMLTPCFVSTFFMLPRYFRYYEKDEDGGRSLARPHLNFIDLLLVDEAGQVPPEIGAPSFGLAKKALVVGDIHQIQPIRSIIPAVDRGNMQRFGLIDNLEEKKRIDALEAVGIMPTEGSVMKVAQARSLYELRGHRERGMFLKEHRRCFNEIIEYCNELVYKNKLAPQRGPANGKELLYPAMGYANVNSRSESVNGGSRKNSVEAGVIADWLKRNREKIIGKYGELATAVGIITPFAAQKKELERALKEEGIDTWGMKIGTIHALQGAERPIVIFSPVYGFDEDRSLRFINRHEHMLNVAVSRAKDSFLVFGNMCLFDPKGKMHSSLLARYLFKEETNELPDVCPPLRRKAKNFQRIAHIKRHCEVLKYSIENAESEITIVSPFISINAINADGLDGSIRDAVAKGVTVKVYTDSNLDMDKDSSKLNSRSEEGRGKLRRCGAKLKIVQGIHNKTLWVDDKYLVEGSFNWLSASRNPTSKYFYHNVSIGYNGQGVADLIRNAAQELEILTRMGAQNNIERNG